MEGSVDSKTLTRRTRAQLGDALDSSFLRPPLELPAVTAVNQLSDRAFASAGSIVKLHLFGIDFHVELDPVGLEPVKRILWLEPPRLYLYTDPAFHG